MNKKITVILFFILLTCGINANNYYEMEVIATAYTHTGNPTATGIYPYEGIVAVDPKIIKLGTKIYVPGYGYAVAMDTGKNIKGYKIDVFFDIEEKCWEWGVKKIKIKIYY